MKALIYINFILYSNIVFGEYRVYQYLIKENSFKPKSIITSLSPSSYLSFFGSSNNFKIDLLRTWFCPGDTSGFKKLCLSPYKSSNILKMIDEVQNAN